jgi:MFS family permease
VKPLYLAIVLSSLDHVFFAGARLGVLLYATQLDASPFMVGLVSALFTIPSIFTSVGMGRWTDRVGARKPMQLGSILMLAGGVIAFFWRDLVGLCVVSAVIGTFFNMFFIAHQRLIGQYGQPEDRVTNFSLMSLGYSVSGFVGPFLAGFAIDALGHAASLLALSLFTLIPIAVIGLDKLAFPPDKARPSAAKRGSMLSLLNGPAMRRMYGMSILAQGTWSIVIFLVPVYGTQIGLSATRIGLLMGSFSLATVVVRMFLPLLSRRLTPWQLLIVSLAAAASAFIAIPAMTQMTPLAAMVFWLGLGLGIAGPMTQALLYDVSPAERVGEALGLRVLMMNTSHSAVPLLTGAVGTAVGVGPVFWVLAATLLGGCYATRAQWRAGRRGAPE